MGVKMFSSCYTNESIEAPNPDPSNWVLVDLQQFENAYVLKVRYKNCSNFEGSKIMVYKGRYEHKPDKSLDPHFDNTERSPIARFKPDTQGNVWAVNFAMSI